MLADTRPEGSESVDVCRGGGYLPAATRIRWCAAMNDATMWADPVLTPTTELAESSRLRSDSGLPAGSRDAGDAGNRIVTRPGLAILGSPRVRTGLAMLVPMVILLAGCGQSGVWRFVGYAHSDRPAGPHNVGIRRTDAHSDQLGDGGSDPQWPSHPHRDRDPDANCRADNHGSSAHHRTGPDPDPDPDPGRDPESSPDHAAARRDRPCSTCRERFEQ